MDVKAEWTELRGAADPTMYHTVVGACLAAKRRWMRWWRRMSWKRRLQSLGRMLCREGHRI